MEIRRRQFAIWGNFSRGLSMHAEIGYRDWFLRVIGWDALLPLCIAIVPGLLARLFPNNPHAIEIAAIVLPIIAFLSRGWAGWNRIRTNYCSVRLRRVQTVAFVLALLLLAIIEACIVLSHLLPQGALFEAQVDRWAWVILIITYLSLMIFAMYPGMHAVEIAEIEAQRL